VSNSNVSCSEYQYFVSVGGCVPEWQSATRLQNQPWFFRIVLKLRSACRFTVDKKWLVALYGRLRRAKPGAFAHDNLLLPEALLHLPIYHGRQSHRFRPWGMTHMIIQFISSLFLGGISNAFIAPYHTIDQGSPNYDPRTTSAPQRHFVNNFEINIFTKYVLTWKNLTYTETMTSHKVAM